MSVEQSRDASRLIEDIELELASIRASMALRPLEPVQGGALPVTPRPTSPAAASDTPTPPVRLIGPFDLTRVSDDAEPAVSASSPPQHPDAKQKPMTLQQRLASLRDQE